MQLRTAIIGCGRIGNRRAAALGECPLVAVADSCRERAEQLAARFPGCEATDDWRAIVVRPDVDLVIVSATNDLLAPATLAAVRAGKHVLVEKPAARNAAELEPVVAAAREARVVVKAGFNHRFHPALQQARKLFDAGEIGEMMFVRGRYGHGGRLGMEKEWRGNPAISGGGEMLDQGVHLIDLSRWFLGEFTEVAGCVTTCFWDWPVEDNGFAMLRTAGGQIAWLHASCTEWKNLFSLEIYGKQGKLHIEGLGGSYGVERLSFYRMLPCMGPPETTVHEYPGPDASWETEFQHLLECIESGRRPSGDLEDALAALRVVDRLYRQSKAGTSP